MTKAMRNTLIPALSAFALLVLASAAFASDRPTVVELYTSQGCHSCPPADAYLGELAKRDDILALSFHVDYWDYIGWKDVYALPANTPRQRAYAKHLGMRYVYTPQMVVQGMAHATGSDRHSVSGLIEDLEGLKRLDVAMTSDSKGLSINVSGGTFDEEARVIAVAFDAQHETDIRRGENAGKKLSYYNVVRDWLDVATWNGKPLKVDVARDQISIGGRDGAAVLVQSKESGRILGAARISLKHGT